MTKTRDLADLGGGFIQAGTGAQQRTVESKLQDVVSVKDFGDTGTGDDTAVFTLADSHGIPYFVPEGSYVINSVLTNTSAYTTGDVIQFAVDLDNGAVYFGKNGTWLNSGVPTSGGSKTGSFLNFTQDGTRCCTPACDAYNGGYVDANFGQRPFSYTPPTGFKALNTLNLPTPTILKGNQYFDATTYTGNGSTQSIVNAGGFQPDLVWMKSRGQAYSNVLADAVRGVGKVLYSNATNAEDTGAYLTAFNSNGFSVNITPGVAVNQNADPVVAWQWKEGATQGFDIVIGTAPASGAFTVNHSLGVAPAMIILKDRSTGASNWGVYHKNMNASPQSYFQQLNTTIAATYNTSVWNNFAPTSTSFQSVANLIVNPSSNFVAYLFAEVAGFSKFGSYVGNGSANGTFVFCGFRPRYVMVKRTDSAVSWIVIDTARNPYNVSNYSLLPNSSAAEITSSTETDILSNGFKLRTTDVSLNASGGTYIYAVFAENPFKNALAR